MLYLDHAATAPLRPEASATMEGFRENFGNPSGVHGISRNAKNAMEEAREEAARLLGAARPDEIIFTGGGSEADNLALKGAWHAAGPETGVVVSAVEHKAVMESAHYIERLGGSMAVVGVDHAGVVDPAAVADAATDGPAVVSVMLANNETGAKQPVADIVEAVKAVSPDTLVHTDAVQAFISEPVSVDELGVDMLSLAAHKFGGPKGVGLLYVRDGVKLEPLVHGGSQERGRRAGTQNPMGIAGMVAAMTVTDADRPRFRETVTDARDRFEEILRGAIPGLRVNGPTSDRLVQHSHVGFPGQNSETLLIRFDQAGLAAAAGSACQGGAVEVSHVLVAMGFTETEAAEAVRFTFGWTSGVSAADLAAEIVVDVIETLS